MAIVLILVYAACLVGLWLLLRIILMRLLKDKYKPSYLLICYLVMLPLAIIALGFFAIALIPGEMPG